jgi:hypothetical protein
MRRAAYHYHWRNIETRGFDCGAAVVFDAQIIQPRVAFDDGLQHLQLLAEWGLGLSRFEQDQAVLQSLRQNLLINLAATVCWPV